MKKTLLTLLTIICFYSNIAAQLNGDGYYRVQNYVTGRYVYIIDNKGSVNVNTTAVDMNAIILWKNFEKAASDPASVIYVKNVNGAEYDLYAQNTSTYDITGGYHVKIRDNRDGTYFASGSAHGVTIYLSDVSKSSTQYGFMNDGTGDYRKWHIIPINQDDDKYFGVKTEINYNGKYYTTMYANFPFSTTNSNTKVYTICDIKDNIAIIREEKGDIAAGTPVIFESTSNKPIDNKLDIHSSTVAAISDNCLSGTYYCNSDYGHINRVANNKSTMRILGTMTNGKLGFITADYDYMPANKAFLVVPNDSPEEMEIMTEEEYQEYITNNPGEEPGEKPGEEPEIPDSVEEIKSSESSKSGIYTILGVKISDNTDDIESLPKGLYIINGRKFVK